MEVEAHAGTHNPDGSTGVNVGAAANAIAAEGTLGSTDNTITFGLSAGLSAEASIGLRDADADGNDEYCVRVGYGAVVGGVCVEPEGISQGAAALYEDVTSTVVGWVD